MTLSVSYVWMREDAYKPHTIPSHLFCRVQENAKRYPDTPFDLWTESPEASEPYAIPPNVTLHSLNSIPAFSKVPVLSSSVPRHIWAKVDVARLLVLQYELRHMKRSTAVYSDMDVPDVMIESAPFGERIKKYGMVIGATVLRNGGISNPTENGYFAVTASRSRILASLVKQVVQCTKKTKRLYARDIVYDEIIAFFRQQATDSTLAPGQPTRMTFPYDWRSAIGSFGVLPNNYHDVGRCLVAEPARPKESTEVAEGFIAAA